MPEFDYLIVGAGLFGAMFAYRAKLQGKCVLVIDKRSHRGGNLYCENIENINVQTCWLLSSAVCPFVSVMTIITSMTFIRGIR